jgi:hypothetical protein
MCTCAVHCTGRHLRGCVAGNKCGGDSDTDHVLGKVQCEFTSSSYAAGAWPNGWCHAADATCKALGVTDNLCGECSKWGNGGFTLKESKMGLRFRGASFDDNEIGEWRSDVQAILLALWR